jgi:hypothetical protein
MQLWFIEVIPRNLFGGSEENKSRKDCRYAGRESNPVHRVVDLDQLPFCLVGRKSAKYLLTVFFNLSNLFIIFKQFIFNLILF